MNTVAFKASELMKPLTLEVTMTGVRMMTFRIWLGAKILRIGAWVMGVGIEFKESHEADPLPHD